MKRLIIASTMCAFVSAGAFAGEDLQWVLDVSGNITSLSIVKPADLPEPAVPSSPTKITQTAVKGYLIVGNLSENDHATFVMVDSHSKKAVFERNIPIRAWSNGKTVMVFAYFNPILMVAASGEISTSGSTLKSLSVTGVAVSETWFDASGAATHLPAYGNIALRNDHTWTAIAQATHTSGEEVIQNYMSALHYSVEIHDNE